MAILLPSVAALVPLVLLPHLSFAFDVVPKVIVLLFGTAAALLFWRGSLLATRRMQCFALLVAAQAAWLILTTLTSTRPALSIEGSVWRRMGLVTEIGLLAFALLVAAHAERRSLLRVTALAGILPAVYGTLQYFGWDPLLPPQSYHSGEGVFTIVRPPATLGHAGYLATYLLYVVFASAGLAREEERRIWRWAAIAASALAVFAILLSGTRAALLGLLAGGAWLAARSTPRQIWAWAAAAGLLVIFYFSAAGEKLRARAHWAAEDPLGGARLLLWRDSLRMAAGRWITGYGPETFGREYPKHQEPELARAFPDFHHESPHNILLEALVERGVPGFLILAGICVLGLASARGTLGAALVAMLVSQQFVAFVVPTALYFYICIALLNSPGAQAGDPPAGRSRWISIPIALVLTAYAVRLGAGDAYLASARRALDASNLDDAVAALERARNWGAHADIYFSRRLLALSNQSLDRTLKFRAWQHAMAAAVRAPETADDPANAWHNLSAFYATENNAAAVETSLRAAAEWAPNWFKPHWLLAQVLALTGRMEEAEAEARQAVDRDGAHHPEVAATLQKIRAARGLPSAR